ncbi:hypothetical protein ACOJVU_10530 [Mycobacterium sp. THU-M104]|uniref:hypothetical protein n=1 Tax=Mycobacterium sp. THU-M104 TaxID=3410515 RepID=UPI003B9C160D
MGSKSNARVAALFGASGLLLAGWVASAGAAGADPEPTPPPAPKTTIDKDGTYAVGSDIVPGIYSSGGPAGDGTCYWKRTGNPDGNLLDNALTKKPQVVRIDATDKSFKTSGCQPWQLTPDASPPAEVPPQIAGAQLGILNGLLGGNAPH